MPVSQEWNHDCSFRITVLSPPVDLGDLQAYGFTGMGTRWTAAKDEIVSEMRRELPSLKSLVSRVEECVRSGRVYFLRIDGDDDEAPPPQRHFVCFGGHPELEPGVVSLHMRPSRRAAPRSHKFRSSSLERVRIDLKWLAGVRFGPVVFPPRILDDIRLDEFEVVFGRQRPRTAKDMFLLQADYWGVGTLVDSKGAIYHWHQALEETCRPSVLNYREWLAEQVQVPALPRPKPAWLNA